MIPIDCSGKTAVVTGGASELGRAISRALARAGADVAITYRQDADKAQTLCQELAAMGRKTMAVACDVTDQSSVKACAHAIGERLGAPSIVVANAVAPQVWQPVLEQDPAEFERQFRTAALQTVHLAQAFIPAMRARRWGRFIAINTECATQLHPNHGAYAVGKRALDGVIRILAKEVGADQVTVNQVAPGWMISDRDRANGSQVQEWYDSKVPLGHRGEDVDIAHAVTFLASDLARFITGCYLPVCGGNVMPAI